MSIKQAHLDEVDGKVGFDLLPDGIYIFEGVKLHEEPQANGRIKFRFEMLLASSATGSIEELEEENRTRYGRKYNEFLLLLDEDEEWYKIGLNKLVNAVCAFNGSIQFAPEGYEEALTGDIAGMPVAARVKYKAPEPRKDGNGFYKARNEITEWFIVESDPTPEDPNNVKLVKAVKQ
jgi:hypothetical protein